MLSQRLERTQALVSHNLSRAGINFHGEVRLQNNRDKEQTMPLTFLNALTK